jgi:hypothetical protein
VRVEVGLPVDDLREADRAREGRLGEEHGVVRPDLSETRGAEVDLVLRLVVGDARADLDEGLHLLQARVELTDVCPRLVRAPPAARGSRGAADAERDVELGGHQVVLRGDPARRGSSSALSVRPKSNRSQETSKP